MRVVWKLLLVVAVFGAVGWGTERAVMRHAAVVTPVAQVRLTSAMAGLFAGGAAAVLMGIALVWKQRQL